MRRNKRRRRSPFRFLCLFGIHFWEGDIQKDWRVIEEKCRWCGKERTLRLRVSVVR